MVSYTEARKKKEKFRKYRESIEAKAKKSVEHQAKIWILLERNGRFYPISYPKDVSDVLDILQFQACTTADWDERHKRNSDK
jgi:hypothetical protein